MAVTMKDDDIEYAMVLKTDPARPEFAGYLIYGSSHGWYRLGDIGAVEIYARHLSLQDAK